MLCDTDNVWFGKACYSPLKSLHAVTEPPGHFSHATKTQFAKMPMPEGQTILPKLQDFCCGLGFFFSLFLLLFSLRALRWFSLTGASRRDLTYCVNMARCSIIVSIREQSVWAAPAMARLGGALALGGTSHTLGPRPEV